MTDTRRLGSSPAAPHRVSYSTRRRQASWRVSLKVQVRAARMLAAAAILAQAFTGCSPRDVVTRVVDGDTVVMASGEKVRYIGIDTPETVHPRKAIEFMGREASAANRALVEGKGVRLEFDVDRLDRYGRTLAYVYVGKVMVNAELIRMGYAHILTVPPNVKHANLFEAMQREARSARRGLWDPVALQQWNGASEHRVDDSQSRRGDGDVSGRSSPIVGESQ